MARYEFSLTFALPDEGADGEQYLDALFEAGCDDAVVGIGERGMIGLDFGREADSADAALNSAIDDVLAAIPCASLLEVAPDMVGVSEIAELVGCARQNIQKYVASGAFPKPCHVGRTAVWHFLDVATWFARKKQLRTVKLSREMMEVSRLAYRINLDVQKRRFEESQKLDAEIGLTA